MQKNLSENIKNLRNLRGFTQSKLAKLAKIPRSTIASIESGSGNPTLSVLGKLSSSLQVTIEELISKPKAQCELYPKGTLPIKTRGAGKAATISKLLPDPIPGMEIDRMEIKAGFNIKGVPHTKGTREYLFCEKGEITLWTSGEKFLLKEGDVAVFAGDQPHSYHNKGKKVAIAFGVVVLSF